MQKPILFILFSIFISVTISCKNETKEELPVTTEKPVVKRAEKKVLTPEDIEKINSLMVQTMRENELKKFTSFIVTAGLKDLLAENKGPFTVFGPSTAAVEAMSPEKLKFFSNPINLSKLEEMLKSHIVEGKMTKTDLMEKLKKSGKIKLKTVSGITLTATKSGDDVIIADGKGVKATIRKSDIDASNGVLHVVDAVLNVN